MAPKKYYAVRKGKKTGIFQTWDECKLQVTGFSGAEYKSFMTLEEAQQYIGGAKAEDKNRVRSEDCAVAYVDGSFNVATGEFSYGAIIFYKGKEERFCEKYDNPELADMRNVAGELEGSMRAMRYCVENGIKELELYYDYMGIEQWCTGGWKDAVGRRQGHCQIVAETIVADALRAATGRQYVDGYRSVCCRECTKRSAMQRSHDRE